MLIGLSGKAGSGKDTVADYLVEKHGFVKLAFAAPLKQGMKHLFGFSEEQLNDPTLKETVDEKWNKTPRQLMQWLGTDILRANIRQDFFILQVQDAIKKIGGNIVICDARFKDECDMIWDMGGQMIRISRKEHVGTQSQHVSENLVIQCDQTISNDSSREVLFEKVQNVLDDS